MAQTVPMRLANDVRDDLLYVFVISSCRHLPLDPQGTALHCRASRLEEAMNSSAPARKRERAGAPSGSKACPLSCRASRWVLAACLCFTVGCVKGRCYQKIDCPAAQVCAASGECVLPEASITPSRRDAGADAVSFSPVDLEAQTDLEVDGNAP